MTTFVCLAMRANHCESDLNSVSANGSDDERPTEEEGAFPSLDDAQTPFGPTRLSFDDEIFGKAQWQDVSPRSADLFMDTHDMVGHGTR